jgi:excinuclease UvrABC nuclease subunit
MHPDDVKNLDVMSLPWVSFAHRAALPLKAGIYFVLNATDTIVYIGRTQSLAGRWIQHHRFHDCVAMAAARIAWLSISDLSLLPRIEQALIEVFHPVLNGVSSGTSLRQTTLRVEPELLRKARFFLDEEGKSINEYLVQQLTEYVRECEQGRAARRTQDCA